ncbi:MAG: hypothetical protein ACRD8W_09860 [Nitrososphaeraceae archaeon]
MGGQREGRTSKGESMQIGRHCLRIGFTIKKKTSIGSNYSLGRAAIIVLITITISYVLFGSLQEAK